MNQRDSNYLGTMREKVEGGEPFSTGYQQSRNKLQITSQQSETMADCKELVPKDSTVERYNIVYQPDLVGTLEHHGSYSQSPPSSRANAEVGESGVDPDSTFRHDINSYKEVGCGVSIENLLSLVTNSRSQQVQELVTKVKGREIQTIN
jgi:hypothetical protein